MPTPIRRERFRLDAHQRADVAAARAILAGSGMSLEDAAQFAVNGRRAIVRLTVTAAIDRFVLSRVRKTNRRGKPLRSATIDWYEDFLDPLSREFGAEHLDTIDRTRFAAWLYALKVGETSRAAIARASRALWRWALAENPPLVTVDATIGLNFAAPLRPESERLVLTVKQCAAILAAADRGQSAIALMLFAGIRPEEMAGPDKDWLRWEHVNPAERYIRVPGEISKTGKTRLLENLPPTVWRWLTPGPLREPISPHTARTLRERAQVAAAVSAWPHDCFRHTAATYLLAHQRDAGIVSEWIGHEGRPTLLHQTYRGHLTLERTQVNHAMAAAYLALAP